MIDTLNIAEISEEVKKLKDNVPEPKTTDAGKIIGVNESGKYELVDAPAGGGSYSIIAQYCDQYGEAQTVGAIFEAFINEVNGCSAPPTNSDILNYKMTIKGCECNIYKFSTLVSGAVATITVAYDEYNKTTGTYETVTFDYVDNGAGTKTTTAEKVSYKTSGITVSDINSMPMLFMGEYFKLYKLG